MPEQTSQTATPHPLARRWSWVLKTACVLAAIALAFAIFMPAMLDRTDATTLLLAHAASMARMFSLQIGAGVLIFTIVFMLFRNRRWVVTSMAIAMLWLTPDLWSYRPRPTPSVPASQDRLTVLSINALYGRISPIALRAEVDRVRPDVIVMQEYTHSCAKVVRETLHDFPHLAEAPDSAAFGEAVFSKRPFLKPVEYYPPKPWTWSEPQISVHVALADQPVRITNIHLFPPVGLAGIDLQRDQTRALIQITRRWRSDDPDVPIILVGDFNCTPRGHVIDAILNHDFHDAYGLIQPGRGGTWPADGLLSYLGPIRIDNALTTPDLIPLAAGTGNYTGSDHKPLWITITRGYAK